MHAPTLPTKATWETPISASKDLVDAIGDVADTAVEAATGAAAGIVRSVRRRRAPRRTVLQSRLSSRWTWVAGGVWSSWS